MDFGTPPPNLSQPPPGMGGPISGGVFGRNVPRPHFRHFTFHQNRNPMQLTMTQDDFDGKRLRKSVMRKTVDYNASIIKYLEGRVWQRDWRDRPALQPDAMYVPDLLPPPAYQENPINSVTTRFVKTATNKMRCPIFAVAWTPEGRRLVTGASSGEFTLWNGLTFNFETILQAHDCPVRAMVWSHNEGWMITGDHSGYVKYWQSNMNNVKTFQAHKEAVRGISFSPTDVKLATCSDDGTLRIFDFYRCQEERILRGHGAEVKCVQWHPSKGLIVSGSKDNQQPIKLWDPKSGTALATLHAHKSTVMDLKWNDNGNWLVTASRDHLLKLFDIRKMNTELQIFRGHKKEASSVAWHPMHEGLFCSGGSDGAILFWNVGTDKEVGCLECAHDSIVWTLAWHPLGHILCSGSNDHTSKFWTRNRPGDLMRDKYNLNTLPPGVQEENDLDEPAIIPGMGPEDKVEIFSSADKAIPGLDLDTSVIPMDTERKIKKVPYSKPIPQHFQAQWNHRTNEEIVSEALSQTLNVENVPGAVPLKDIVPDALIIYGKILIVDPGTKIEAAILQGSQALKRFIASGELEQLHDVMPYLGEAELEEEVNTPFVYIRPKDSDIQKRLANISGADLENSKEDDDLEKKDDEYSDQNYESKNYDRDNSQDFNFSSSGGSQPVKPQKSKLPSLLDLPTPQFFGGPPGNFSGPPGNFSGPPGNFSGPPGNFSGPPGNFSGPPGNFSGPPGNFSGPPGNFLGPPGNFSGPPGNFSGPPGNYSGPPGHFSGPPGNFSGPPGNFSGPPGNFSGPPGNFPGPPGNNFNGPPPNNFQEQDENDFETLSENDESEKDPSRQSENDFDGPSKNMFTGNFSAPPSFSDSPGKGFSGPSRNNFPDTPTNNFSGPPPNNFSGPPGNFQGPPGNFQGPPGNFQGPPGNFQGPPGNFQGPPGNFQGPPSNFQGPPPGVNFSGPPGNFSSIPPPGNFQGPKGNFGGQDENFDGADDESGNNFRGPARRNFSGNNYNDGSFVDENMDSGDMDSGNFDSKTDDMDESGDSYGNNDSANWSGGFQGGRGNARRGSMNGHADRGGRFQTRRPSSSNFRGGSPSQRGGIPNQRGGMLRPRRPGRGSRRGGRTK